MAYWVALDVAIDQNDDTIVLGIFTDEATAREVSSDHEQRFHQAYDEGSQSCYWRRSFTVIKVDELDHAKRLDYESNDPWGRYADGFYQRS